METTGWSTFVRRAIVGVNGTEAEAWVEAVCVRPLPIGEHHLQAYRCRKFGFCVHAKYIKDVTDWPYATLMKEKEKVAKGESFNGAPKLKGVWPRVMLEKSIHIKHKWAGFYNVKKEVDDILENKWSPWLEAFVEYQRFRIKVAPILAAGSSSADLEAHRKQNGLLIVQVKSESDRTMLSDNITETLGIIPGLLEKGRLERTRA